MAAYARHGRHAGVGKNGEPDIDRAEIGRAEAAGKVGDREKAEHSATEIAQHD